jgi:hypothetical protein
VARSSRTAESAIVARPAASALFKDRARLPPEVLDALAYVDGMQLSLRVLLGDH